jgi:hypothetical protein
MPQPRLLRALVVKALGREEEHHDVLIDNPGGLRALVAAHDHLFLRQAL